jgi:transcriptional regulator with XRE-family HTH domain
MTSLRYILTYNLKENRRKLGFSQAKLAEKAGLSTQYIAMIELARKFPSPEKLELLAKALEIDPPELFSMPPSLERSIKRFQKIILADIEQAVGEAVNTAAKDAIARVIDSHLKNLEKTQLDFLK